MSHRLHGHAMRKSLARGFTLIELLIAMTLTLMLVYAIARFYAYIGETVRDGRAQIEMGGQLRAASQRLQKDFAELTVRVGGRIDAGQGMGCLEIWEGIASDSDPNGNSAMNNGVPAGLADVNNDGNLDGPMLGDCDDILVMTIRSQGEPFVGRRYVGLDANGIPQYAVIQSNLAEVIWFTTFKDTNLNGIWDADTNGNGVIDAADSPEPRYLVRRQLLIVSPNLTVGLPPGQTNAFQHNDISAHWNPNNNTWAANSLSDLSQRQNRCVHQNFANFPQNGLFAAQGYMPNTMQLAVGIPSGSLNTCTFYSLDGIPQFIGEDRILSNVLAFDVRVYDPYAVLRADNLDVNQSNANTADDAHGVLQPGDPGYAWAVLNGTQAMGSGAYVDLWYNRGYGNVPGAFQNSAYSWAPQARNFPGGAVWDTWTTAYEKDGLTQAIPPNSPFSGYPARPTADWMVDGLDNNNSNGVDDPSEAETQPPYPVWVGSNGVDDDGQNGVDDSGEQNTNVYPIPIPTMLRGIEVRIRMYEPGTRQTRQATVATDFIPE